LLTLFRLPFFVLVLVALASAVAGTWILAAPALLAALVILVLGRDPERRPPSHPLAVVSPLDGRVEGVDEADDPFLERRSLVVRLRQGIIAPAVLHSPIEGRVENIWGGESIPQGADDAIVAIHLRTDEADNVVFTLSRAWLPGPIRWLVQPGERVGQGQRRGLAGWGRCATVYMPVGSQPAVQSGDKVQAGVHTLARLVHPQ